jgi:hypothetical protein
MHDQTTLSGMLVRLVPNLLPWFGVKARPLQAPSGRPARHGRDGQISLTEPSARPRKRTNVLYCMEATAEVTVLTDPTNRTDIPGLPDPTDSTRILSAILEPDGSISLLLRFSGCDAPVSASIDPIETTVSAAGQIRRPIELRYGHEADRLLRLIVAMHADALAYERSQQKRLRFHPPTDPQPDRRYAHAPARQASQAGPSLWRVPWPIGVVRAR